MNIKIKNKLKTTIDAFSDAESSEFSENLKVALDDSIHNKSFRTAALISLWHDLEEVIYEYINDINNSNSDTEIIGSLFFIQSQIIQYLMIFTPEELMDAFSDFFFEHDLAKLSDIQRSILDSLCATIGHINSTHGGPARQMLSKMVLLDVYNFKGE